MRSFCVLIFILVSLLFAPGAFCASDKSRVVLSLDKELALTVSLITENPQPGQAIWVVAEVKNVGTNIVEVDFPYPLAGFRFSMVDGLKRSVPLTRYGSGHLTERPRDPFYRLPLNPGETQSRRVNLSLYFDLSEEGDYLLKIEHFAKSRTRELLSINDLKVPVWDAGKAAVVGNISKPFWKQPVD